MRPGILAAALLAAFVTNGSAMAADYLDEIKSPVFETSGERASLTRRVAACFAKNSGVENPTAQTDPEGGTVVGPTLFPYTSGGIPWSVKATLTIEVKDGKFRMSFANIIHKQGGPATQQKFSLFSGSVDQSADGGWNRVGLWKFSGGEKVQAAGLALADKIAECVKKPADDW